MNQNPYHQEQQSKSAGGEFPAYKIALYAGGIVGALLMFHYLDRAKETLELPYYLLMILLQWVLLIAFGLLAQLLHECGRLVMGRLSGCRFLLFRVGSAAFVREQGKIVRKRFSVPGVLWQSMMTAEPAEKPDDVRYFWYYFGGAFFDLVGAAIAGAAMLLTEDPIADWVLFTAAFTLLYMAVLYLIPSGSKMPNEGRLLLLQRKDPQARVLLRNIMALNGMEYDGTKPQLLPDALFAGADAEGDSPYSDMAVMYALKLVSAGNFAQAEQLLSKAAFNPSLNTVYSMAAKYELAFCAMMLGRPPMQFESLLDDKLWSYLKKSSQYNIASLRFRFAHAALVEHDSSKAAELYAQAKAMEETSLCRSEYDSEMEMIDRIAANAPGMSIG